VSDERLRKGSYRFLVDGSVDPHPFGYRIFGGLLAMTPDIAALKKLAEDAIPGPWAYQPYGDNRYGVGVMIAKSGDETPLTGYQEFGTGIISEIIAPEVYGHTQAAYIAALDPATALALIARAATAEQERDHLLEVLVECEDDFLRCERCDHQQDAFKDSDVDYLTRDARTAFKARATLEQKG
jgi:hypothetical protein